MVELHTANERSPDISCGRYFFLVFAFFVGSISLACYMSYVAYSVTAPAYSLSDIMPAWLSINRTLTTDRYVVLDRRKLCNGRRLGNHMFSVAALMSVGALTKRRPVLPPPGTLRCLRDFYSVFEASNIIRLPYTSACPCQALRDKATYDRTVQNVVPSNVSTFNQHGIALFGYFQSWRYAALVGSDVRRALTFNVNIKVSAARFLAANEPTFHDKPYVRVGVHVRRGDMTRIAVFKPPGRNFFIRAMQYFVNRYPYIQFVVASNDRRWSQANVINSVNKTRIKAISEVSILHSDGRSPGHDLAVLSMCNHTIVSAGTFGWWAAWLANGTTVYFKDWPRVTPRNAAKFNRSDYYPPHWIPLND